MRGGYRVYSEREASDKCTHGGKKMHLCKDATKEQTSFLHTHEETLPYHHSNYQFAKDVPQEVTLAKISLFTVRLRDTLDSDTVLSGPGPVTDEIFRIAKFVRVFLF